ncbi:phage scaffolding protein [Ligilactobacillus apodemi]|uniref:phage scaffolding protein n=1 Tax=Ligilactobacillus apodemi TaxID=307126 RepID=UPI00214C9E19|nr:phage scaffolding protein [Ligilactobacillus apodemi]MCR1902298.1 phage scaffolding protein [Ligilactobacillus apodemi]
MALTREFLKEHGLSDEQITSVMTEHGKTVSELTNNVQTLTNERNNFKAQVTDRDKQLDDLKRNAGDNEALQQQIKKLQDDNKAASKDYETKLASQEKEFKIQNALRDAKARNVTAVQALLKTDDITVGDDNKLNGLDNQLEEIKKSNPFLFDDEPQQAGRITIGGKLKNDKSDENKKDPLISKIAERMANDD